MGPTGMEASLEHIGPIMYHTATGLECMGTNNLEHMSLESMGVNRLEHMGLEQMDVNSLKHKVPAMGSALGAGIELMGLAMYGTRRG